MTNKKVGLLVKFANNDNETIDGTEVVFVAGNKIEAETKMSEHYDEKVSLLFIDELWQRKDYDTLIKIGCQQYYAFTKFIDI